MSSIYFSLSTSSTTPYVPNPIAPLRNPLPCNQGEYLCSNKLLVCLQPKIEAMIKENPSATAASTGQPKRKFAVGAAATNNRDQGQDFTPFKRAKSSPLSPIAASSSSSSSAAAQLQNVNESQVKQAEVELKVSTSVEGVSLATLSDQNLLERIREQLDKFINLESSFRDAIHNQVGDLPYNPEIVQVINEIARLVSAIIPRPNANLLLDLCRQMHELIDKEKEGRMCWSGNFFGSRSIFWVSQKLLTRIETVDEICQHSIKSKGLKFCEYGDYFSDRSIMMVSFENRVNLLLAVFQAHNIDPRINNLKQKRCNYLPREIFFYLLKEILIKYDSQLDVDGSISIEAAEKINAFLFDTDRSEPGKCYYFEEGYYTLDGFMSYWGLRYVNAIINSVSSKKSEGQYWRTRSIMNFFLAAILADEKLPNVNASITSSLTSYFRYILQNSSQTASQEQPESLLIAEAASQTKIWDEHYHNLHALWHQLRILPHDKRESCLKRLFDGLSIIDIPLRFIVAIHESFRDDFSKDVNFELLIRGFSGYIAGYDPAYTEEYMDALLSGANSPLRKEVVTCLTDISTNNSTQSSANSLAYCFPNVIAGLIAGYLLYFQNVKASKIKSTQNAV